MEKIGSLLNLEESEELGLGRHTVLRALNQYERSGEARGLMVSALFPGASGPGFEPWPGTLCCVLGQDT